MSSLLFSLKTRVSLIVGFGLFIFTLTMVYQAVRERDARIAVAENGLANTAHLITAAARKSMESSEVLFANLVLPPNAPHRVDPEDCQHWFQQVVAQLPDVSNALFALPDGKVICSAVPMKQVTNIADWPGFKSALTSSKLTIGKARASRVTGKQVLPVYQAIRAGNGAVLGVLHIGLGLSWLYDVLRNSKYREGGRVGLIDDQGRVLARYPDPESWVGRSAADTSFFKAVLAHGGEGIAEDIGFDGVPRIYGLAHFYPTRTGQITLWVGYAADKVTAVADRYFRHVLIGTAVLLLLAFIAIWMGIERLILRPVAVLSAIARRLGSGDLSARSGIGAAHSEMGELARSFDDMAEALESKNSEIALAGRALKVLSAWNQALLNLNDEQALAEGMCKAIVDAGEYQMAWVGFAESGPDKIVRPVAFAGDAEDYFETLRVTWADTPSAQGPVARAIREGVPIIVNDALRSSGTEPWREHVRRFGYSSVIALPLKGDPGQFGVLVIGAAETAAFAEREAVLLAEVASDLASAILAQRLRAERERLRMSLRSVDERFAAAAEASPDAQFVFASVRDDAGSIVDFEITAMNARAAQQIGMPREDAIGKTYLGLLPNYMTPSLFDDYAQVASTGTRFEKEFQFDVPNKGIRWFRQQVVRVGDGIAISLRDVTAWKKAGEKLRQSEKRLRRAMAAARMGAWQWDLASDQLSSSDGMGLLFGLPSESGPQNSKEFLNAVHPADRSSLADAMASDRRDGSPGRFEFRVVWPDASIHWLASNTTIIRDAGGARVQVVGLLTDINERKQAEIARDRAIRALRTLSAANEELVHATSESALLHAVCRVVVEKGGYRTASVAYPKDDPEKSIIPMASAQADQGYVNDDLRQTWADTEEGQSVIARAIRAKTFVVDRNISDDLSLEMPTGSDSERSNIAHLALPLLDGAQLIGALSIRAEEGGAFDDAEIELLRELSEDLAYGIKTLRIRDERDRIAREHEHHEEILRRSLVDSIQAIVNTVERRDPYTAGHQNRVALLAVAIARKMGLDEETIQGIHLAGVVHDLGKISVPAEILSRPGRLSAMEYELIKIHPQAGYDILKGIQFPWPIANVVWEHHERIDGTGYPRGIKGGEILLESRIMAVADVVEAMASHRPYRASLGIEPALKEIERGRSTIYDPVAVDACLILFREERFVLPT